MYHNRNSSSSSGDKTKQHEAVLSNIPEDYRPKSFGSTIDTRLHDSFRTRLSTYASNSTKTANSSERSSTNSISGPGHRAFRRFSRPGSVNVHAANLADSLMSRATSVRSSVTKRSSGTQALLAHLLRPTSCLLSPDICLGMRA